MILKINKNFRSIITNQLINSNKLNFEFKILNSNLLINSKDLEEVDKILNRNFHKYKVLTKQIRSEFDNNNVTKTKYYEQNRPINIK